MPGITGVYLKKKTNLDLQDLNSKMAKSITHYDWYKIDKIVDKKIACNRVSLGVLTPEPQPISNEDKNLWVMMEGEIYDYDNLKKGLIEKGHTFKLNDDPEFILYFYEEYGEDFGKRLKDLNGIFLIVIYDNKLHKLTICNDRYGFRPLYVCDRGDYLLFSSEVKAILQDNSFKRVVNLKAVADFFSFGYLLRNKTLIESIELLPPALMLTCNGDRVKVEQYWNLNQIEKIKIRSEEEVVEELGKLWLQAVDRRMKGSAKIGIALSGGLDSRAIASAISPECLPVHAVTFGNLSCDDYQIGKKVTEILGIEHHFVEISGEKWFSNLERGVYLTDGLLNVVHQHTLDAIDVMKEYFDVVFNGFAGDLVIGGSYLTNEVSSVGNINQCYEKVFKKMNCGHISIEHEKEFYSSQILALMDGLFPQKSLEKEIKEEIIDPESSDYFFLNNRVRRFTLMGSILVQTKLENRKPFFDNDFIEFVYGLPNSLRFNSYIYNKMLLRFFPKAFQSIPWQSSGLPIGTNKIVEKLYHYYRGGKSRVNKFLQGVGLPLLFRDNRNFVDYDNWVRNHKELREYIYNTLANKRALSRNYFIPDFIRQIIDEHMSAKKNNAQIIGLLLTFELFNRMFVDGENI